MLRREWTCRKTKARMMCVTTNTVESAFSLAGGQRFLTKTPTLQHENLEVN